VQVKRLISAVVFAAAFPALAIASSATGAVSTGHSAWEWGNPLPQGNDILAVEFSGNRGYAAGNFGTLLTSTDSGAGWAGVPTGITANLNRVRIIDGDSLVVAGGCSVRRSDNAGGSFARLAWTANDENCPATVTSLSFPSEDAGYLLIADGSVFRTADGGKSWARRTAVPGTPATGGNVQPADIAFVAHDTGVVVTSAGTIYRTTDGGTSWTLVKVHDRALLGLFFVDANNGYAVGAGSSVLKTIDGGVSWIVKSTGGSLALTSIRCAVVTTCLATTDTGDRLLRTVDGADSFSSVTPSTEKILAASFASPTRAIAAGSFGATVVSDDAGATWAAVGGRMGETFRRLRATDPDLAVAVGERGTLARTTNGGQTWAPLGVSTAQELVDASFPTAEVGYALDSAGAVLRTENGGASWQILDTGSTVRALSVLALDARRVLLVGPRGLLRSTNSGTSFGRVQNRAARTARVRDADFAGGTVFAWGARALVSSRNGGKTWRKLRRPARSAIADADFVGSRAGLVLTADGRVWVTRSSGRRWRVLAAAGSADGGEIAFGSTSSGWLALDSFAGGGGGHLLRSSDGGRSWRPQLVDDDLVAGDGLAATGRNTAVLLTAPNTLLFTTTGGDQGDPSSLRLRTKKRRLARAATIKVTGRLSPAEGGERVVVSMRRGGSARWRHTVATVASSGSFTTSWRVSRTSHFVAQWSGDDDRSGAGSRQLTVKRR
jgi:photosystem II stability/assembly factor-like uncharacterized protein